MKINWKNYAETCGQKQEGGNNDKTSAQSLKIQRFQSIIKNEWKSDAEELILEWWVNEITFKTFGVK